MKGIGGLCLFVCMTCLWSNAAEETGVISFTWSNKLSMSNEEEESFISLTQKVYSNGNVATGRDEILARLAAFKKASGERSVLHLYNPLNELVGFLHVQEGRSSLHLAVWTLYSDKGLVFKYLIREAQRELSGKKLEITVFNTSQNRKLLALLNFKKEESGIRPDGGSFCRFIWDGYRDESYSYSK